ncbi:MAG TPA: S-ribosylhomocysteine lyase, partial [Clostridium sp.]
MKKIDSFTINHLELLAGVYVSRKDKIGECVVTTFDIRMTRPNFEPVMNTADIHAIEHLGATYLRNHKDFSSKVIYFGPMGCRTGFYLLLSGDYTSKDVLELLVGLFKFISVYEGDIPG